MPLIDTREKMSSFATAMVPEKGTELKEANIVVFSKDAIAVAGVTEIIKAKVAFTLWKMILECLI